VGDLKVSETATPGVLASNRDQRKEEDGLAVPLRGTVGRQQQS
jgi:hypothetical protein